MAGGLALHDTIQQLVTIGYGIWRKRWYALATACLISVVGWALVYTIPYKFESTARVQVNIDEILDNLTRVGVRRNNVQNSDRDAQNVKTQMTQRNSLEKIIRSTNYLERLAPSELEMNRLVADLKRNIKVLGTGENVFQISYENDDERLTDAQRAEVVRDVVAGLVNVFITETTTNESVETSINFVDSQIARLNDDLRAIDDEISSFRAKNLAVLSGDSITRRLEKITEDLNNTENEISELEASIMSMQESLKEIPPTIQRASSSGGGSTRRNPLEERIDKLSTDRDKLYASGFKDKHPDVVNLTRQIKQLEKELEDEKKERQEELKASAEAGRNGSSQTSEPNPVYEELMGSLFKERSTLRRLQKRQELEQRDKTRLASLAESAPQIELEYDRMSESRRSVEDELADMEKNRQNLLTRNEKAEIDTLQFKVLDDPVKPVQPSGPPRLIYLTLPLIGGLIVGIGVALVLSQIKPVVITVDQLRHTFDLPVLGNVTRVLSEKDAKARMMDLLMFGGIGAMLIVIYVLLVALDMLGI